MIVDNGHLVAYITLRLDSMRYRDDEGHDKKISTEDGDFVGPPAVRIGLLASDKRAKGAGRALVEWALDFIAKNIAPIVGVRFVMVDAYYDPRHKDKTGKSDPWDSARIYHKLGFQYVNPNEKLPPKESFRSMFFDLKPLINP
jgi:GNAT superfamily N-acetyltransferase